MCLPRQHAQYRRAPPSGVAAVFAGAHAVKVAAPSSTHTGTVCTCSARPRRLRPGLSSSGAPSTRSSRGTATCHS
eukprot:3395983-Alexandrium_andersonii.AAC.1